MNSETDSSGFKVMLIDDTEVDAYISKRMLTKSNFSSEIMEFYSAEKALDYLQENSKNYDALPQIIFLDIHMPAMNGFDFLEKFQSIKCEIRDFCKVVMLTSSVDENDVQEAKKYPGILKFLIKPLQLDQLQSLNKELLATNQ
ncbi:MAG: response regulator [Bacteroidetes bacterium]|nr:MAG: response regulator [Bacteroidota bacterium]